MQDNYLQNHEKITIVDFEEIVFLSFLRNSSVIFPCVLNKTIGKIENYLSKVDTNYIKSII